MLGILVKNAGNIVEKQVIAGDDEANLIKANKFITNHPELEVSIHRDSDADWKTAFEDVVVPRMQGTEQIAWQTAKAAGPAAALAFIARHLGLE